MTRTFMRFEWNYFITMGHIVAAPRRGWGCVEDDVLWVDENYILNNLIYGNREYFFCYEYHCKAAVLLSTNHFVHTCGAAQ